MWARNFLPESSAVWLGVGAELSTRIRFDVGAKNPTRIIRVGFFAPTSNHIALFPPPTYAMRAASVTARARAEKRVFRGARVGVAGGRAAGAAHFVATSGRAGARGAPRGAAAGCGVSYYLLRPHSVLRDSGGRVRARARKRAPRAGAS